MLALSHENEKININEPFKGLFTQGMVCHETYKDEKNNWLSPEEIITIDGYKFQKNDQSKKVKVGPSESMSKSKKNTIDPEKIIENYGGDSVRLFILSDSPPEKDVQWSDEGIISSYKFIQKLWVLNEKISLEINKNYKNDSSQKLEKFTNQFIKKMTDNLNSFSYNILIANLHEMHSFLSKEINNKYSKETLIKNYSKILIMMLPIIPHFTLECLEINNFKIDQNWPSYDETILIEDKIKFIIQINGIKRDLIEIDKDLTEKDIFDKIMISSNSNKYLIDKKIKKKIFIKNKLMNIVV